MEENKPPVPVHKRAAALFSVERVDAADTWPPDEAEIEAFIEAIRSSRHLPCCEHARGK